MAPFDRSCTTFYWSAVVNIAVCCTIFELFDVEQYRELEIWVRDHSRSFNHSRSFKMAPFESLGAVSYSPSTDIGRKLWFFSYPVAFDAPVRGIPVGILPSCLVWKKLECWGYPTVKNFTLRICITVYTQYRRVTDRRTVSQTGRQTDGQTSCHCIVRAMHTRRAVKTAWTPLVGTYSTSLSPNWLGRELADPSQEPNPGSFHFMSRFPSLRRIFHWKRILGTSCWWADSRCFRGTITLFSPSVSWPDDVKDDLNQTLVLLGLVLC